MKRKNKEITSIIILMVIVVCGILAINVFHNAKYVAIDKMGGYSKIKFSEMYETRNGEKQISSIFQSFNGKNVELSGYMAVQSPLDKSYIYLVNQPYVSCPFCAIGDITKLEVIPVYMANGATIEFKENGVTIKGNLEVGAKEDTLGYTTQCRINADKVIDIEDTESDKELKDYYATLSNEGMIIDMQTLQMDIEYATNPEWINELGTTKASIVDAVVAEYLNIKGRQYAEGQYAFNGISDYLRYIKECPEIVEYNCKPEREDLIKLNDEFVTLYNEQIKVLEKFVNIILEGNTTNTEEEKEAIYDKLIDLNQENLALYEAFTNWNNRLRES